jgi:phosphopantetheinyl transferase (holo-ACP synthase)
MEYKSEKYIFRKNGSLIGIAPVRDDSELLLTQLENKSLYLPFLEKMSEYRRQEWLSVRVLLKELLGEEKEIAYLPSGKPFLVDHSWFLGISHTKCRGIDDKLTQGYVALILSMEKEVAIDIEQISPKVEKVQSRFVNEWEERSLSGENKRRHLLLYWSAKESIFKILNKEDVSFKNQLHIAPFEPVAGAWRCFEAHETRTDDKNTFTVNYFVHRDYVVTFI